MASALLARVASLVSTAAMFMSRSDVADDTVDGCSEGAGFAGTTGADASFFTPFSFLEAFGGLTTGSVDTMQKFCAYLIFSNLDKHLLRGRSSFLGSLFVLFTSTTSEIHSSQRFIRAFQFQQLLYSFIYFFTLRP